MKKYAALAGLLLAALAANATVIDFEGVAPAGGLTYFGPVYSENGFNLTNPGGAGNVVVISQTAGYNGTGSDFYGWNSIPSNNPIVLANALGNNFSLVSLDVGGIYAASSANFDIIGHLALGGTVTYSVLGAGAFSNVVLNWSGLSSVDFNYTGGNYGAIDNLNVNVSVPDGTSSLTALGLALVALAIFRRRLAA